MPLLFRFFDGGCMRIMAWDTFRHAFRRQIATASHTKLKTLNKEIHAAEKRRFVVGRPPRNELVEFGFSDGEFQRFMAAVDDPELKCAFMLMAVYGLRPQELVNLRGKDIVRGVDGHPALCVDSLKGGSFARIRLPDEVCRHLPARAPHEPLFGFATGTLRNKFAECRKKAGLEEVYLYTLPCGRAGTRNRRFRLSLKSFRHYGIQHALRITGNPEIVRLYARHRHMETTLHYFQKNRLHEVEFLVAQMADAIISSCQGGKEGRRHRAVAQLA